MTRSCVTPLLAALAFFWGSSPLSAQNDYGSLLQDVPFVFNVSDLTANDSTGGTLTPPLSEISIDSDPSNGTLIPSAPSPDTFTYQPKPDFFGIDSFRYSWIGPNGLIEGIVELFVAPWQTPLSDPADLLLLAEDRVGSTAGYYNSHSRTFYFCAVPDSTQRLNCTPYRYSGSEPGWLPLMGTWQNRKGQILPDRPGLYDPKTRRIYLLQEDLLSECSTCFDDIPALSLKVIDEFELDSTNPSAVIPIAADLDRDGIDSVVLFRPSERRFDNVPEWAQVEIELTSSTLWPLVVQGADGFDDLAVFRQQSGRLTGQQDVIEELESGVGSLPVARQIGTEVIYEVYDFFTHTQSKGLVWLSAGEGCQPNGTHVLRFPSDPDPPPNSGTFPVPVPCAPPQ